MNATAKPTSLTLLKFGLVLALGLLLLLNWQEGWLLSDFIDTNNNPIWDIIVALAFGTMAWLSVTERRVIWIMRMVVYLTGIHIVVLLLDLPLIPARTRTLTSVAGFIIFFYLPALLAALAAMGAALWARNAVGRSGSREIGVNS